MRYLNIPALGGVKESQVGSPDFHHSWPVMVPPPNPVVSVETIVGSQNFHPYVAGKRSSYLKCQQKPNGETGLLPPGSNKGVLPLAPLD